MGAYVSKEQCEGFHSVRLNCIVQDATATTPYRVIGGLHHGEFEPNPDVAGVGILYAFFSVAALALLTSLIYLVLQITPFMKFTGVHGWVHQLQKNSRAQERHSYKTTWADVFEGIILSCSDQQVFTSGAYALTLRYAQGCKISAYHYNIVANMMLITCATHLMSITVVSQYWKHKLLAVFRILLVTALYIVTALLLSNQNAGLELQWPTATPVKNETDTLLVLPAACFQGNQGTLDKTLKDSFGRGAPHLAVDAIGKSSPNNHIVGWNFFILMVLWYGAAIIAEGWRYWLHWYHRRGGLQENAPSRFPQFRAFVSISNKWISRLFWVYQAVGTIFCVVAIVMTFLYIQGLRGWMNRSPWMKKEVDGTNPEYDATSFGQLVPLLLTLLTVFTTLQLVGDKFSDFYHQEVRPDAEAAQNPIAVQDTTSQELPEKKHNVMLQKSQQRKDQTTVEINSVPPTPLLELNEPEFRSKSLRAPNSSNECVHPGGILSFRLDD